MTVPKPDGSKYVLLTDHRDGQCRSIEAYVNGEASKAVYCGHPVVTKIDPMNGRLILTSWCPYHASIYHGGSRPRPQGILLSDKRTKPSQARKCAVCSKPFEPATRQIITCSDTCRTIRKAEQQRAYEKARGTRPKQAVPA